ncbi:hypothetical protein D1BOALGB6SA_9867 [Olavius sp. associated proteobacterium Delta 1]|nr:hypothetical protein D1BOALGB6SA_9867 [Olavius sp. associated proteobacterium Delta 1]
MIVVIGISTFLFLIFLLTIFWVFWGNAVSEIVAGWLHRPVSGTSIQHSKMREISTQKDLWLNGYLGIFFRVKFFGYINWLAIPLVIYFLTQFHQAKRWQLALLFVLTLSTIIICTMGYKNYRYQLTLYPVILTLVLLYTYDIIIDKFNISKKIVNLFLMATILITLAAGIGTNFSKFKSILIDRLKQPSIKSAHVQNPTRGFPAQIIQFLNNLEQEDWAILECNQPILYYYTNKRGVYYLSNGVVSVLIAKRKKFAEIVTEFKKRFNIKYIFISEQIEALNRHNRWRVLNTITKNYCDLIMEEYTYKLYRLR